MSSIRVHSILSNLDLEEAAKALHIPHFRGVFMRNALPPTQCPIECGILNHDDRNCPGTHWTCWHKHGGLKVYFDPYGPPNEIEVDYLRSEIRYNTDEIQRRSDVVCGHFCLHVLKLLLEGRTLNHPLSSA